MYYLESIFSMCKRKLWLSFLLLLSWPRAAMGQWNEVALQPPRGWEPVAREYAEAAFRSAVGQDPNDLLATALLELTGILCLFDEGKAKRLLLKAETTLRMSRTCLPKDDSTDPPPRFRPQYSACAEQHLILARLAASLGETKAARTLLDSALEATTERTSTERFQAGQARAGMLLLDGKRDEALALARSLDELGEWVHFGDLGGHVVTEMMTFLSYLDPDAAVAYAADRGPERVALALEQAGLRTGRRAPERAASYFRRMAETVIQAPASHPGGMLLDRAAVRVCERDPDFGLHLLEKVLAVPRRGVRSYTLCVLAVGRLDLRKAAAAAARLSAGDGRTSLLRELLRKALIREGISQADVEWLEKQTPEAAQAIASAAEDAAALCDLDRARGLLSRLPRGTDYLRERMRAARLAALCDAATGAKMLAQATEILLSGGQLQSAARTACWLEPLEPAASARYLDEVLARMRAVPGDIATWRRPESGVAEGLAPCRPAIALELLKAVPGMFERVWVDRSAREHIIPRDPDFFVGRVSAIADEQERWKMAGDIAGEVALSAPVAARKFVDLVPAAERVMHQRAERNALKSRLLGRLLVEPEAAAREAQAIAAGRLVEANVKGSLLSDLSIEAARLVPRQARRFCDALDDESANSACVHGLALALADRPALVLPIVAGVRDPSARFAILVELARFAAGRCQLSWPRVH